VAVLWVRFEWSAILFIMLDAFLNVQEYNQTMHMIEHMLIIDYI